MNNYSIIIPVYNEDENIKILVDDIEDSASSRRVEFRIETTAFQDIIEGLTGNAK